MKGLYIAKMWLPRPINIRAIYEEDKIDEIPAAYDEYELNNDTDMVINWMGQNTLIHSSLGPLTDARKVKVFYDHPRTETLQGKQKRSIEDGLGDLFIEQLFRGHLGLEYDYTIDSWDEEVVLKSGTTEQSWSPGDSFTRPNGEEIVFIGVENGSTLVFETKEILDGKPIEEVDAYMCSIKASPNLMAAEFAMKDSDNELFTDNTA